ncbi:capsular polysaccharide biosynthesis protein [Natranaerovirga pectinivora]|uniref:Capsular polysaccharide biosynthesis protein n=1 Tax=Natranaerovirga pectinivora TaxID=682400 RepID=A0A4R3MJQ8_9FIRM|nr:Wzz/FepE/Etk N-terminal domain-containing protein [Natranaerovirga pectinivora]TCT12831.1 capsular polysaccharide biosynthesis protein [Natranaerovirga pectinivora]
MVEEVNEIDLREIIGIVLEKWWLILVLFVISAGSAAYITSSHITPMYKTEATLFIGKEADALANISFDELRVGNQLITDYRELIKTRLVTEEVIGSLGLNVSISEFRSRLDVSTISNSRFFHIGFTDPDPELASMITNRLAEVLVATAVEIVGVKNVQIVDSAIPTRNPVSPNLRLNVAIAGILGIMIAIFLIFLLNMMDNTIKKEEDIEKVLGLTVLGVIPKFDGEAR